MDALNFGSLSIWRRARLDRSSSMGYLCFSRDPFALGSYLCRLVGLAHASSSTLRVSVAFLSVGRSEVISDGRVRLLAHLRLSP